MEKYFSFDIIDTNIEIMKLKSPLPKEAYDKNANIYKILSNAKRLEILNLLKLGEMSVENILKVTKLSKARREGLNIHYRIIDPRIVEPCKILHELRHKHQVI